MVVDSPPGGGYNPSAKSFRPAVTPDVERRAPFQTLPLREALHEKDSNSVRRVASLGRSFKGQHYQSNLRFREDIPLPSAARVYFSVRRQWLQYLHPPGSG